MAIFAHALERLRSWATRQMEWGRSSRRLRRIGITVVVVVVVFGLFGFFGVPAILRHVLTGQVAQTLHRPVTVGDIAFNPYRLRLEIDKLHIGDRDASVPFVDIGHFHIKVSWKSLFRLAPIVSDLAIDHPEIHVIRTAENRFNFSDLLERPNPPPPPKPEKPSQPMHFAVSNIQIDNGNIYLDDRVLNQKHSIQDLHLGLPFIANLPADLDIFVQPLLKMKVDGSPMRLNGSTKPFGPSLESIFALRLHRLDLPLYAGYVPVKMPVKLADGKFSSLVQIHFVNAESQPHVRLDGEIAFDTIDVRDLSGGPLVGIKHASILLNDIRPLEQIIRLGRVRVEALSSHVVLNADGTTNLTARPAAAPSTTASSPSQVSAQPVAIVTTRASLTQASPSPAATQPQAAATAKAEVGKSAQPTGAAAQALPSAAISSSLGRSSVATAGGSASATATPASAAHAPVAPLMAAAPPQASATAAPASPQTEAAAQKPKLDFSLDAFDLVDSTADFTDRSHPTVAAVALSDIRVGVKSLHTLGDTPTPYEVSAKFNSGGTFQVKGNLELTKSQVATDFSLNQLDLAALKAFAEPYFAGDLKSGKLNAKASIRTDFAPGRFNVHVEPASASLDNFNVQAPGGGDSPIAWNTIAVTVGQVDLASRKAAINEVRTDGIKVFAHRDRKGHLNFADLARSSPHPSAAATASAAEQRNERERLRRKSRARGRRLVSRHAERKTPPSPAASPTPGNQWQYQVASFAMEKTQIRVQDDSVGRPVKVAVEPFNLHLKGISNDLSKAIGIDLDATVNRTGVIKVAGSAAPNPLKANLKLNVRKLDIVPVDAYVTKQLNAKIVAAALTIVGVADVENEHDKLRARYRGDVTLGNVRMLDKLTGDNFLRWNSFSARRIDADYGAGLPKVHVGALALSSFYARIILNSDGRLNLKNIASGPQEAPKSLTRAGVVGTLAPTAPATPSPTATASPTLQPAEAAPAPSPKPLQADIALGQITLDNGHINYTDNFIKPHYTADMTDVGGKIGALGTKSTAPATVALEGQLNGSAPINVSGSINPLVPMAFVDIAAKANGVELRGLSPYSAKYTGYPIIKGTLTVDVHYLLEKQTLTATNHIYIDQITFGDHVTEPNAANLPVRLAVALLSDSRGVIDLNIPISGSLNDPQFSVGAIIWVALKNLVIKALTSPFSLIASAFGGGGGSQDLNYVEFEPGYATLTPDGRSRLETIAKALEARPGLKLDISGRVDPSVDRDGLRHAELEHLIEEQKIKDVGEPEHGAPVVVSKDEYDKYLKRAYKAAKFEKPRDLIGLTKSLPPDEMKKLILANVDTSEAALKRLADERANAIREFLSRKKIDPGRLFIVAPKLSAEGIKDKGKTSRADLSLK
ncbi:MAG: DUF748 domain-containing protein [Candidatus Binataceae bacterium]